MFWLKRIKKKLTAKGWQNEQDQKGKIKGNKVGNIFTISTLHMLRIFGMGIVVLGVIALFKHKTAAESWLCGEDFRFLFIYFCMTYIPFYRVLS